MGALWVCFSTCEAVVRRGDRSSTETVSDFNFQRRGRRGAENRRAPWGLATFGPRVGSRGACRRAFRQEAVIASQRRRPHTKLQAEAVTLASGVPARRIMSKSQRSNAETKPPSGWVQPCAVACLVGALACFAVTAGFMVKTFNTIATSPSQPKPSELTEGISWVIPFGALGTPLLIVGCVLLIVAALDRRRARLAWEADDSLI